MENKPAKTFLNKADRLIESAEQLNLSFFKGAAEVGKRLIAMIEENPDTITILVERCPRLPREYWLQLQAMGYGSENTVHKLLGASVGAERAIQLLIEQPAKLAAVLDGTFKVVEPNGIGGSVVRNKSIEELSGPEARRVISKNGVTPIEEQTARINREKLRKEKPVRYTVSDEGIQFHAATFLSFAQLQEIIQREMPKQVAGLASAMKKNQIATARSAP